MIEVSNLTKVYGNNCRAIDNLTFSVKPNSIMGLIGSNGAGKTTVLNIITGALLPTSGKVKICGKDILLHPIQAKHQLAYIPDDPVFFEHLTAIEFCRFIGSIYGVETIDIELNIAKWFDLFGLEHSKHDLIETFSHGMRKKLQLIAACLHVPKVIVMDEPTSGLDPEMIYMIKQLAIELKNRGVAILLATHDLALVEEVCTDICILHKGSIVANNELSDIQSKNPGVGLECIFLDLINAGKAKGELLKIVDYSFSADQVMEEPNL